MAIDLGDYNDVPSRIVEFRDKYPEGSFQPANPERPFYLETVGAQTFVVYVAAAYRTPDDPRPGIGTAWEPVPGTTPYTKNSEIQNAETSAWGRAIVAALAADAKKIGSAEEVRNRHAEREPVDPAVAARADIARIGQARNLSLDEIAEEFALWSSGGDIRTAAAEQLEAFRTTLTRSAA